MASSEIQAQCRAMRRLEPISRINTAFRAVPTYSARPECLLRIQRPVPPSHPSVDFFSAFPSFRSFHIQTRYPTQRLQVSITQRARIRLPPQRVIFQCRAFSNSSCCQEVQKASSREGETSSIPKEDGERDREAGERAFARTEKASRAAQVNLSARLSKEGASSGRSAGFGEVWRLLKIARPEAKWLGSMSTVSLLPRNTVADKRCSRLHVSSYFIIHYNVDTVGRTTLSNE